MTVNRQAPLVVCVNHRADSVSVNRTLLDVAVTNVLQVTLASDQRVVKLVIATRLVPVTISVMRPLVSVCVSRMPMADSVAVVRQVSMASLTAVPVSVMVEPLNVKMNQDAVLIVLATQTDTTVTSVPMVTMETPGQDLVWVAWSVSALEV